MHPAEAIEAISAVSARERVLIAMTGEGGGGMEGEPDKVAALLDTVRVLEKIGVSHALIGGVAVGIYSGVPRATLDTDLGVSSTADTAVMIAAVTASGFELRGEFPHSINFRHSSGEPVQLAFDPGFDEMIERAGTMQIRGVGVSIVSRQDLIEMKRRAATDATRRKSKALRDRADIELLLGDVPEPDEGW